MKQSWQQQENGWPTSMLIPSAKKLRVMLLSAAHRVPEARM